MIRGGGEGSGGKGREGEKRNGGREEEEDGEGVSPTTGVSTPPEEHSTE